MITVYGRAERDGENTVPGIAGQLARHARDTPERLFLTWYEERLSYGEADALVRGIAARLIAEDLANGRTGRIVIFLGNCPAAVIVWIAAQAAGLVPVTLNREHRGEVLTDVVTRSDPSVLVCDAEGSELLSEAGVFAEYAAMIVGTTGIHDVSLLVTPEALAISCIEPVPAAAPATVMFSSGTTGRSKGVVIPHGMFDAGPARLQEAWSVTADDVFHCWVPWFHVAAQQDVFALAIRAGACVALVEGFSLSRFWDQIRQSGATVFGGFVTVLEMLYAQPPSPTDTQHRLRFGIAGHIPGALKTRFEKRFGVPMVDAYGMSEAEPLTIPTLEPAVPLGSVGRENPDFELAVQDESGVNVAPGQEGQIVFKPVRPNVMMREYLDDPERSTAAWRNGWFLTGDLGFLDSSGNLFYRDRLSEFIRVRGENVSPQEVESVLMSHPEIREVAVLGVAAELGEHDVVALIVSNNSLESEELREWCNGRMAKFMIPKCFIATDRIPRTPTSKVQRAALAALLEQAS
ncbi:class I adenylate-forming enzyme family protein [Leucobacter chinensis]|uniref:class I adenylate-forming enzyme family protein n=1 Tax=Leucobacter chinensis TaxID=2851010 RepID=UPI001C2292D2